LERGGITPQIDKLDQVADAIEAIIQSSLGGSGGGIMLFDDVPLSEGPPIIYVPPFGLMEWVNTHGMYRSVDCGQVILHSAQTARPGYLVASGASVPTNAYKGLWTRAQEDGLVVTAPNWVSGALMYADNGDGTVRLPDLRGQFLRAWSAGSSTDSGRGFGTAQGDAIRNLVGDTGAISGAQGAASGSGVLRKAASSSGLGNLSLAITLASINIDASRSVPTASENRPMNTALLACIKF